VIANQAAAQQVGQTRLVNRLLEAAVRRPAVAYQDAGEVRAEDGGRFVKTAARLNRVHRRLGRSVRPQPLEVPVHFPPGFVGSDHRADAHRLLQCRIRRHGAVCRATGRVHEPAGRDRETESLAKQRRDFAERQPELFVQHDRPRHGGGPELRGRGADRIRCLQRVASLHASAAVGAVADGDGERAHDGRTSGRSS
jgi:hypothetical protein